MGLVGKMKVDDVSRIPVSVRRFFDLKKGDYLEFYPPLEELGDAENLIAVKIVRSENEG